MSKERILIVDDEVVIRSLLSELLSEDGYTVATAEDGKRGLECASNGQVDLVSSAELRHRLDAEKKP